MTFPGVIIILSTLWAHSGFSLSNKCQIILSLTSISYTAITRKIVKSPVNAYMVYGLLNNGFQSRIEVYYVFQKLGINKCMTVKIFSAATKINVYLLYK